MRTKLIPRKVLATMPAHLADQLITIEGVEFFPDGSYRITGEGIPADAEFNCKAALRRLAVLVGPGAYRLEREPQAAPLAKVYERTYTPGGPFSPL